MVINKSEKILIAGASGMVGGALTKELLNRGYTNLHLCVRKQSVLPDWVLDNDHITIHRGNLLDYFWLEPIFDQAAWVFNAVGSRSIDRDDRDELIEANIAMPRTWVNLALQFSVSGYIHISSAAALGRKKDGSPCKETDNWQKNEVYSDYNKSKFLGEMEVFRGQAEGLNVLVLNPSTIIGQGGVLQYMLDQVDLGTVYIPQGKGGYVFIENVVDFAISAAEHGIWGERFILNADNIKHEKICHWVSETTGQPLKIKPMTHHRWRLEAIRALWGRIWGKKRPIISKSSFRMLSSEFAYSNQKALDTGLISFLPLQEAVKKSLASSTTERHLQ